MTATEPTPAAVVESPSAELNTVNNQLQDKVEELEATNNDMGNLLNSTDIATIFLDRELTLNRPPDAPLTGNCRRFEQKPLNSNAWHRVRAAGQGNNGWI